MGMSPPVHLLCYKMSFLVRSNAMGNILWVHGLPTTEALGVVKANPLTGVMSNLVRFNFYSTVPNLPPDSWLLCPRKWCYTRRSWLLPQTIRYLAAVLARSFLARRRPYYWPECIPFNLITTAPLFMGPLSKLWGGGRKKQVNMRRAYMSFVYLTSGSLSPSRWPLTGIHVEHKYLHGLSPFWEAHEHTSSPDFVKIEWQFGPLVTSINSKPVMSEKSGYFLFPNV